MQTDFNKRHEVSLPYTIISDEKYGQHGVLLALQLKEPKTVTSNPTNYAKTFV